MLGLARAMGVFGKGDVGGVEEEVAMMRKKQDVYGWLDASAANEKFRRLSPLGYDGVQYSKEAINVSSN